MLKLMVVDDEASIRRGLKSYINWSAWDIDLAAEAANIDEAEERAASVRPEILITDIRMPGGDGLELCRRLRRSLPSLRIILLSGYDDKEYLRAALAVGVREYLLKPAGADTIISSVLKLREEILAERDKERQLLDQKNLLSENFAIIQMYFINELLSGRGGDAAQLRARARTLDMPLDGPCFQTVKARFLSSDEDYTTSHEIYQNYWRRLQLINVVSQQVEGSFFCELEPQEYFLLMNGTDEADVDARARTLALTLAAAAEQKGGQRVAVGVGTAVRGPEEINVSYRAAKAAFEASAWEGDRQVFFFVGEPGVSQEDRASMEELVSRYSAEVSEGRPRAGLEAFYALAERMRAARPKMALVREYARQLLTLTARLSRHAPDGETLRDYLCHLDGFYGGEELLAWLQNQLETQLVCPEGELPAYSPIVQKALTYMRANYTQDITLQNLAKEVFISPNYLGRIFRQGTGFKLNEWLNRYRVERAKELLLDPGERTAEVAERVGFNSYKYFSICFQKFVGCSLGDYRREYTRKGK